jgi:dipeptidyl aminopeptidase/acylaminoacyl peptidase
MSVYVLRALALLVLLYGLIVVLAWRYQDRLAFPAPRMRLPTPAEAGLPDGRRVEVTTADGVTLRGWYLPPAREAPRPAATLLWFCGNMETVAGMGPLAADWRPAEAALLFLDYRGYGESDGTTTEQGLYRDADAAWGWLAAQPALDTGRVAIHGRSLGAAVALYLATRHPVRAVVLDSPFSSARALARLHYWFLPSGLVHLSMDNVARAQALTAPLFVAHGTADRIAPIAMGRAVADAGHARTFLAIEGAGHNDTYDLGDARYRDAMRTFLRDALR